jgi:hypothetical protein
MNTLPDKEQTHRIFTGPRKAGKSTAASVAVLFNEVHVFTDKRITDEAIPSGGKRRRKAPRRG